MIIGIILIIEMIVASVISGVMIKKSNGIKRSFFCLAIAGLILMTGVLGYLKWTEISPEKIEDNRTLYLALGQLEKGNYNEANTYISALPYDAIEKDMLKTYLNYKIGDYDYVSKHTEFMMANRRTKINKSYQAFYQNLIDSAQAIKEARSNNNTLLESAYQELNEDEVLDIESLDLKLPDQVPVETLIDTINDQYPEFQQKASQYQAIQKLEEAIMGQDNSIDEVSLEAFENNFKDDSLVTQTLIDYYVANESFDKASILSTTLLENDPSLEHLIMKSDFQLYELNNQYSLEEIIEAIEQKKNKMHSEEENVLKGQFETLAQADEPIDFEDLFDNNKMSLDLEDESNLMAKIDAINTSIIQLDMAKPKLGDKEGQTNLQIAKLLCAIGNYEMSSSYFDKFVDEADEGAALKARYNEILTQNYNFEGQFDNQVFYEDIRSLLTSSNIYSDVDALNNNHDFTDFIGAQIKYDTLKIQMDKVDTASYPKVSTLVNLWGDDHFVENYQLDNKDFKVIDTYYDIDPFHLIEKNKVENTRTALVVDVSGSMEGAKLINAKMASKRFIDSMSMPVSLIKFCGYAETIVSYTSDKEDLHAGVDSLSLDDATDIYEGLMAGIQSASQMTGDSAVLIITDGEDDMLYMYQDEVIRAARENSVHIYNITIGDFQNQVIQTICSETGGQYLSAYNAMELGYLFGNLEGYIVSSYALGYEVKENVGVIDRYLELTFKDDVQSTISYSIADKVDSDNRVVVETIGVSPSQLSQKSVRQGVTLTLTGLTFNTDARYYIGTLPLEVIESHEEAIDLVLKGDIPLGDYPITIINPDGSSLITNQKIRVSEPILASKIKIGDNYLTANTMELTSWGNAKVYLSDNVAINNFLYSSEDVRIDSEMDLSSIDIDEAGIFFMGDEGYISGDNLYVTFDALTDKATFAQEIFKSHPLYLAKDSFGIAIHKGEAGRFTSDFKAGMKIPFFGSFGLASLRFYTDKIILEIGSFKANTIFDNVAEVTEKGQENVPEKNNKNRFGNYMFVSEGKAIMTIKPDDVIFGFEMKLDARSQMTIGSLMLKSLNIKLNSADLDNQYWKIGCDVSFENIIPGFKGVSGYISSYYWCPDEIEFMLKVNPGVPIYDVAFIDEVGANVSGLSRIILESGNVDNTFYNKMTGPDYQSQDIVISGLLHAEINLFKSLHLPLPSRMLEWGDFVELDNARIGYNITQKELLASYDVTILKQRVQGASLSVSSQGLNVSTTLAALEIEIFDLHANGKAQFDYGINSERLYTTFELEGQVNSGLLNVHASGYQIISTEVYLNGKYYSLTLDYDIGRVKCWYEKGDMPLSLKSFHKEVIRK